MATVKKPSKVLLIIGVVVALIGAGLLVFGFVTKASYKTILLIVGGLLLVVGIGLAVFGYIRSKTPKIKIEKTITTQTTTASASIPVTPAPGTVIVPATATVLQPIQDQLLVGITPVNVGGPTVVS